MTTTPPAPTVTVQVDDKPCPRVDVVIAPMPVDAATVTVWRISNGRRAVVRDASNAPVAGDYLVIDYDVPLGESVTYTAQTFDGAGTPSQMSPQSDAVYVDTDDVWISDPLDPSTAVPVALAASIGLLPERGAEIRGVSFREITRPLNITIAGVFGSPEPLAFGDLRQAPTGIPLEVYVWDKAVAAQLRALVAQAFPLSLRTPDAVPQLPGLVYLACSSPVESVRADGTSVFNLAGDSVAGPGAAVALPARTYDDLTDEASSYDGLLDLYSSYLDLQRGG